MSSRGATTPGKPSSFEPSVWGDFFISYEPQLLQRSEEWMRVRAVKLKEDVQLLFKSCNGVVERMILVDVVQHLGIEHHFEEQIDTVLIEILDSEFSGFSLHEVALRFRLLREHGHWVSTDVFTKFKDGNGCFNRDIANGPRGLLSLYNAAHVQIHGEPELEEAITFARHHLESMSESLKSPLAEQVNRALHLPLPRTYMRVETVHYISEYAKEDGHSTILLEFAKLDFNLLQHVHLKELKAMTEWWKELSGFIGLSYVRDRLVENYLWSFTVHYEEHFGLARIIAAKINVLLTIMDDTYDNRATIEECRVLHEAAQRWDKSAMPLLPEYLKMFYKELLRNIEEIGGEMTINGNHQITCINKQVNLSIMTICVPTVTLCGMAAMGDAMPKEALEWIADFPEAVIACAKIARFMNDITSFNRGKSKGDVASSVECYITEHGVAREVAVARIESLVEDAWRSLKQARFGNRALLPAVQRVVNLALSLPLYYGGGNDAFTFSTRLRKTIETLFVNPIPI